MATKSIADLRTAINAKLDTLAGTYGENVDISTTQTALDAVSHGVDSENEIWNANLPTRPHQ